MSNKCDQCNNGFFNFPICEGNQQINILLQHLYKNYLTFFILLSKLVIVMQMAQQILPVMATVYVIVNPISRMTNVTHAVLGFLILVLVKVRNTVEVNLYRSLNN